MIMYIIISTKYMVLLTMKHHLWGLLYLRQRQTQYWHAHYKQHTWMSFEAWSNLQLATSSPLTDRIRSYGSSWPLSAAGLPGIISSMKIPCSIHQPLNRTPSCWLVCRSKVTVWISVQHRKYFLLIHTFYSSSNCTVLFWPLLNGHFQSNLYVIPTFLPYPLVDLCSCHHNFSFDIHLFQFFFFYWTFHSFIFFCKFFRFLILF